MLISLSSSSFLRNAISGRIAFSFLCNMSTLPGKKGGGGGGGKKGTLKKMDSEIVSIYWCATTGLRRQVPTDEHTLVD